MVDAHISDWLSHLLVVGQQFQFLRPLWLWLLPLVVLWVWWLQSQSGFAGWARVIDKKNLKHLGADGSVSRIFIWFGIALIVAILALAGPSVSSLTGKGGHSNHARVFVLDLSPSMLARDILPDRLTVAKLKLIDLLRLQAGSRSGLVVYAADAYQVTPVIDDAKIIESLVPVLHPDIMPARGSNAEQGLELAARLISTSGYTHGDIVLITDGLAADAIATIRKGWQRTLRLSILAVGTSTGATIPDSQNSSVSNGTSFLLDAEKNPVVARLNIKPLEQLASDTGGRFTVVSTDSSDVDFLSEVSMFQRPQDLQFADADFDQFHDAGYWLALVLLPLVLMAFRKNVLWVVLPLIVVAPDGHAFEWKDLWFTKDQQAQRALENGETERASRLFSDPRWRAVSLYQLGQYADAVSLLDVPEYADDLFNRGNAMALSGDYEGALVSYQIALQLYANDQDKQDTVNNIRVIRHLLDRAEQQDQQSNPNASRTEDQLQQSSSESEALQETQAGGEQTPIGGLAGGEDTLQQQALAEQSDSDATDRDIDDAIAADANAAADKITDSLFQETTPDDNNNAAKAETNNNQVLSPYSEQWLREIPGDPAGYLRRKFGYQAQIRAAAEANQDEPLNAVVRY